MFIFILLYETLQIDLPKETYLIKQNDQSLFYQMIIQQEFYDIDLNNEFSVTGNDLDSSSINSEKILCDTHYKCQFCEQQCAFTYFDTLDNEKYGELYESIQKVKNYKGQEIVEEFISLTSNDIKIIGLGVRQAQQHNNYTFPQNPFVSKQFSICFGNLGYFHRKVQQDLSNSISLKYNQLENQYILQFQQLQLSKEHSIKLNNINVTFDSLNPYTQVPNEIFKQLQQYYKQMGFSLIGQNIISIHKSKFQIENLQPIKLFINETFYLEFKPNDFLYFKGNYIELPFKKSNKKVLILGITFLQNLYLSVDQNINQITISQRNCQNDIIYNDGNQKYYIFLLILMCILLIIIVFIKYCRKYRYYKNLKMSSNLENAIELPNQESQRQQDIQEETEVLPNQND